MILCAVGNLLVINDQESLSEDWRKEACPLPRLENFLADETTVGKFPRFGLFDQYKFRTEI
jgi:hypothetical protein